MTFAGYSRVSIQQSNVCWQLNKVHTMGTHTHTHGLTDYARCYIWLCSVCVQLRNKFAATSSFIPRYIYIYNRWPNGGSEWLRLGCSPSERRGCSFNTHPSIDQCESAGSQSRWPYMQWVLKIANRRLPASLPIAACSAAAAVALNTRKYGSTWNI